MCNLMEQDFLTPNEKFKNNIQENRVQVVQWLFNLLAQIRFLYLMNKFERDPAELVIVRN